MSISTLEENRPESEVPLPQIGESALLDTIGDMLTEPCFRDAAIDLLAVINGDPEELDE